MSVNMEEQFLKLQDIVLNQIDRFFFFAGAHQYLGPVQPVALISFAAGPDRINALVLSEAVPAMYLPPKYAPVLHDAVIVFLDKNFEFKSWDAAGRSLFELNLLVGDPKVAGEGTIEEAKTVFGQYGSVLEVLYREDGARN